MNAAGRGTAFNVKELASDNTSKLIHHPPHHAQQRASYLDSGSCYTLADLALVDGCRPVINPSGAQHSLSPALDPLVDVPCRSLRGPRARRPGSEDTTDSSSADSGIQSAGPSQGDDAGRDLATAVKTRQEYYKEVCRVVYKQRMPIVQEGYLATGGRPSNGAPSLGGSRVVVDGRLRGLPDHRGFEKPLARNSYTECGSVGQWCNEGVNRGVDGYAVVCGSRNGLPSAQHNGFNHDQVCVGGQQGPVRGAVRNGPAADRRNGVAMVVSGPQQEQRIREDYLRRRSNSNDSGYHDRNAAAAAEALERSLHAQGLSDRCLEAHQLSLSAPSTPIHSSPPKKSSTPNMIRRQLKTISEAVMTPLLRPKSTKEKSTRNGEVQLTGSGCQEIGSGHREMNVNASSDVSDNDEGMENGRNLRDTRKSPAGQSSNPSPPPPLLQNSASEVRRPVNGGLSSAGGGAADSSASKKPKALASRSKFWSKKFGELKSAPSSPELSRRHGRTQEPLMDGHITVKTPTNILQLTEGERMALQKIALQRLQQIGLGQINVSKSGYERRKTLKGIFQLKRHGTTNNGAQSMSAETTAKGGGSGVASGADPEKEKSSTRSRRWTFGIHLESCINNDAILGRVAPQPPGGARKSTEEGVAGGGRLLDALSLSVNPGFHGGGGGTWAPDGQTLQVPYVVRTCCSHLKEHALRVKGLFRIGGLKSRVIQLKHEFDSGSMVQLTADHSPHDVASLLKEFLRDLPHCLLTRDLFQPFVATASLKNADERLMALRFLVALLPVANRDTLWMLLSLLKAVVENSSDQVTRSGIKLPGNCMDSSNLATLFGPNILHKFKPGKSHVDSMDQLNQHLEVIAVVKEMINSFEALFRLPEDVHREILDVLMEQNPEAAEYILCHQGNGICPKVPSDSSLRLFDDLRENSFLTNSNSSTVSSDVANDQPRPRDFVAPVVMLQRPPLEEQQNHPKNRTSLSHSSSSTSHSFQTADDSGFDRLNGNLHKSPLAGNGPIPWSNGPGLESRELQQSRGFTSTPKSESRLNGDVNSGSRLSLSPAFVTGATQKGRTENGSQRVAARRFGQSPAGRPEVEGGLSWEQQRWKYWEELAKKDSEELHELQTLV